MQGLHTHGTVYSIKWVLLSFLGSLQKDDISKVYSSAWHYWEVRDTGTIPWKGLWDPTSSSLHRTQKLNLFPVSCTPYHDVLSQHRPQSRQTSTDPWIETARALSPDGRSEESEQFLNYGVWELWRHHGYREQACSWHWHLLCLVTIIPREPISSWLTPPSFLPSFSFIYIFFEFGVLSM